MFDACPKQTFSYTANTAIKEEKSLDKYSYTFYLLMKRYRRATLRNVVTMSRLHLYTNSSLPLIFQSIFFSFGLYLFLQYITLFYSYIISMRECAKLPRMCFTFYTISTLHIICCLKAVVYLCSFKTNSIASFYLLPVINRVRL